MTDQPEPVGGMNDDTGSDADFERLADEFADRCARGEPASISEYCARYPSAAARIRSLFPTILQMHSVGTAESRGSDPGDPVLQELGEFRLIREIGRGGMGVVYEAEQRSLGRRVALKLLPSSSISASRQQMRFELESRAAARLHHSNIVPVHGVGEHEGLKYYVMQLIDGCGLDDIVREVRLRRTGTADSAPSSVGSSGSIDTCDSRGAIGAARRDFASAAASWLLSGTHFGSGDTSGSVGAASGAPTAAEQPAGTVDRQTVNAAVGGPHAYRRNIVRLGVRVADALHYAHSQGVLHRDVKPSNLMLDTSGHVWIMDFGLAKADDSQDLTQTGDLVGTLRYMPPERFRGESDSRSDVYSLGLTLYELLLLRPGFDAPDREQLLRQITHISPVAPRRVTPGFPRDLETILLKACDPLPARRYASAGALRDDLQRFLDGRSILARRSSPIDRLVKWSARQPLVAGLTISVGLLVVVAIIGISWQWRAAESAREAAEFNLGEANQQRIAANAARRNAERNERAAEAGLKRAIEAVDAMLTSVAREDLNGIPRMDRVRRDLLNDARQILEQLLAERSDSDLLKFETAKACARVSDICRLLGSYSDAEQSSDRALALLNELVASDANRAVWQFQLATALNHRARLAELVGDDAEAERRLRRAVAIRSFVADADGQRVVRAVALAGDLTELASLLTKRGRFDEADPLYRRAQDHCESLLPDHAESAALQSQLATTCSSRAGLERRMKHFSTADELQRRALSIRRDLVANDPRSPERREDLAISYNNLGFLMRLRRRTDSARSLYQKSVELREQLVRDNPDVPSFRKRLAFGSAVLARITSDPTEKERLLRRAFTLRMRLTEEFPRNPEHWRELTLAWKSLSRLLSKTDRRSEVDELADQLTEAHQRYLDVVGERLGPLWVTDDSPEPDPDVAAIDAFIVRADELRQAGIPLRSLPLYDEAREIVEAALEADPDNARLWRAQADLHRNWMRALSELDRTEAALDQCARAVHSAEQAVRLKPEDAAAAVELAVTLRQRALLLETAGRSQAAQSAWQQSVAVRAALAEDFPEDDDFQAELAAVCREAAATSRAEHRDSEALDHLNRGVDVCRGLVERAPARRAWRRDLAWLLEDRGLLKCESSPPDMAAGLADLSTAVGLTRELLAEKAFYEQQHCHVANELAWKLVIAEDPAHRDGARALALAEDVVALRPADDSYQNTLGVALLRAGQWKAAQRALEQAVLLAGGDALDFYALAIVMARRGRMEDAVRYRRRAEDWCRQNVSRDPGLAVLRQEAESLVPESIPLERATSDSSGTAAVDSPPASRTAPDRSSDDLAQPGDSDPLSPRRASPAELP